MIGIYKITSPTGKIYIGQSKELKRRIKSYQSCKCISQTRLYRSFLKHGVDNHKFEIICTCNLDELNNLERYYQELYMVTNKNGLNCQYVNSNTDIRVFSEEIIGKFKKYSSNRPIEINKKISNTLIGRKLSENHILNLANGHKKKIINVETMEIYESVGDAAHKNGIKLNTLSRQLTGYSKNKTKLIFLKNFQS